MTTAGVIAPEQTAPPIADDLAAVVTRAQAGDEAAFAALVARYRPALLQHAQSYAHDWDEAEGLTQDALLKAWLAIGRTAPGLRVAAWLHRITARVCLDWVRHDRLIGWVSLETATVGGTTAPVTRDRAHAPDPWRPWEAADPDPAAAVGAAEGYQALWAALARLPNPRHRRVLELRMAGLSYDELAAALRMTRSMVKSYLFRARQAVQQDAGVRALGLVAPGRDLPAGIYRVHPNLSGHRRGRLRYAVQTQWQGQRKYIGEYSTLPAAVAALAAWREAHGLPAAAKEER